MSKQVRQYNSLLSYFPRLITSASLLLLCNPVQAAEHFDKENTEPQVSCADSYSTESTSWLDRTHSRWSERVCNTAANFDHFFGDSRNDKEYTSSFVRLYNSFVITQENHTVFAFNPRLRARIVLPNLQKRLNVLITDDSEDQDSLSPSEEALPTTNQADTHYNATLRWIADAKNNRQLNLDVGIRLNNGLDPFVKSQFRYYYAVNEKQRWTFGETFFWRAQEGFGEKTQLDLDHQLGRDKLIRWTSVATFSEESQGVDWLQQLTLFHQLDTKQALSYTIATDGFTLPHTTAENYSVSMRYRRNIYRPWLFYEVEPQLNWPLEENHEFTPAVIFRIEALFGKN